MNRKSANKGRGRGCCQKDEYVKKKTRYEKDVKKCKFCGNLLSYEKRKNQFCSSSCSASFNNKGIRRNYSLGTREEKKCLNCENMTKNCKFCCSECFIEYCNNDRKKKIIKSNKIFSQSDKKHLIDIRGHKCEICHIEEWLGNPILLILDHIDGNSDNNYLDNLRLLCSNCDATLPTYKSKNKNNGRDTIRRKYRQIRYKSGSCN